MTIKELTIFEFDKFIKQHPLNNYYQTLNYGLLMAEYGFSYDLIGYVDNSGDIVAASLILIKSIGWKMYYGYAPRGFLIDYVDKSLLHKFTEDLKRYYNKKNVVFIKINPEIAIGEINKNDNYEKKYNQNTKIIDNLKECGFKENEQSLYFENILPRFNAILHLKKFNIDSINKNIRNKVKKGLRKGLSLETVSFDKINILYKFVKDKKSYRSEHYYRSYYNIFNKDNNADLFLLKINYEEYLIKSQEIYAKEQELNNLYNELLKLEPSKKNINKKMESDRLLTIYKQDIIDATKGMRSTNNKVYIAAALVVKYDNRINIVISGFDRKYKKFNPNHFLHYQIFQHYKEDYTFADLNGLSGDFSKDSLYYGLNQFKLGFNPKVYEFIGEFDLIVNETQYFFLEKIGKIKKEFTKE